MLCATECERSICEALKVVHGLLWRGLQSTISGKNAIAQETQLTVMDRHPDTNPDPVNDLPAHVVRNREVDVRDGVGRRDGEADMRREEGSAEIQGNTPTPQYQARTDRLVGWGHRNYDYHPASYLVRRTNLETIPGRHNGAC